MLFKGFSIFSSGGPFCSAEQNHFSNFGKGVLEKQFCEIILKSGPWPRRRCCLKSFLFFALDAILFSGTGTILAISVEGHSRNIPVTLFQTPLTGLGGDVF